MARVSVPILRESVIVNHQKFKIGDTPSYPPPILLTRAVIRLGKGVSFQIVRRHQSANVNIPASVS